MYVQPSMVPSPTVVAGPVAYGPGPGVVAASPVAYAAPAYVGYGHFHRHHRHGYVMPVAMPLAAPAYYY